MCYVSALLTSTTLRFYTHLFLFECWLKWFRRRCFVPPTVAQATMMDRSWRHFYVFCPFMVAGLLVPAQNADTSTPILEGRPVAPTTRSEIRASAGPSGFCGSSSVSSAESREPSPDTEWAAGADESSDDEDGWNETVSEPRGIEGVHAGPSLLRNIATSRSNSNFFTPCLFRTRFSSSFSALHE